MSSSWDGEIKVDAWGFTTGNEWSYKANCGINQIIIRYGEIVDSIMFKDVHTDYSTKFGGPGGNTIHEVNIDFPSEFLTGIRGTYGHIEPYGYHICWIKFQTNVTEYGPFGTHLGQPFSFHATNVMISGFHGRAGQYVDAIGVYLKPAFWRFIDQSEGVHPPMSCHGRPLSSTAVLSHGGPANIDVGGPSAVETEHPTRARRSTRTTRTTRRSSRPTSQPALLDPDQSTYHALMLQLREKDEGRAYEPSEVPISEMHEISIQGDYELPIYQTEIPSYQPQQQYCHGEMPRYPPRTSPFTDQPGPSYTSHEHGDRVGQLFYELRDVFNTGFQQMNTNLEDMRTYVGQQYSDLRYYVEDTLLDETERLELEIPNLIRTELSNYFNQRPSYHESY